MIPGLGGAVLRHRLLELVMGDACCSWEIMLASLKIVLVFLFDFIFSLDIVSSFSLAIGLLLVLSSESFKVFLTWLNLICYDSWNISPKSPFLGRLVLGPKFVLFIDEEIFDNVIEWLVITETLTVPKRNGFLGSCVKWWSWYTFPKILRWVFVDEAQKAEQYFLSNQGKYLICRALTSLFSVASFFFVSVYCRLLCGIKIARILYIFFLLNI